MNNVGNLLNEAYNELMHEFQDEPMPSSSDIKLGDISAQLAQAKGELATIIDRASREGIIRKNDGKIQILKKDLWLKKSGDLPQRIKNLQRQLTPNPNEHANEPN